MNKKEKKAAKIQRRRVNRRCTKKRWFATEAAALASIPQINALNFAKGQVHKDKGLNVFHCTYCGKWHVGHKNNLHKEQA